MGNLQLINDRPVTYRAKDLQEILHIGKDTAYELMHASAFPSMKLGGKWLIEKSALESWLLNNRGREFAI